MRLSVTKGSWYTQFHHELKICVFQLCSTIHIILFFLHRLYFFFVFLHASDAGTAWTGQVRKIIGQIVSVFRANGHWPCASEWIIFFNETETDRIILLSNKVCDLYNAVLQYETTEILVARALTFYSQLTLIQFSILGCAMWALGAFIHMESNRLRNSESNEMTLLYFFFHFILCVSCVLCVSH